MVFLCCRLLRRSKNVGIVHALTVTIVLNQRMFFGGGGMYTAYIGYRIQLGEIHFDGLRPKMEDRAADTEKEEKRRDKQKKRKRGKYCIEKGGIFSQLLSLSLLVFSGFYWVALFFLPYVPYI